MTRRSLIAFGTAALLSAGAVWTVSKSAAEPISEADRPAAGTPAPTQSPELVEAQDRLKNRDFDGAVKLLKEAAKKDPDLSPPFILVAEWFLKNGSQPAARHFLERAVLDQPNDPEAYILMGAFALREGRITEAKMLYDKADSSIAEFKGTAKRKQKLLQEIFAGLAGTAEAREQWSDVQKYLEAWLKVDSKSAPALQRLAQCLFHQKNVDGALEKLREAAKVSPDMLKPEVVLSDFYAQAGDKENSKKLMAEALAKYPKDFATHLRAAQRAFQAEQVQEASEQVEMALDAEPNSLDAKNLRGVIALFQKDYKKAEIYFEQARQKFPNNFAPSNNLALALVEQDDAKKKEQALDYAEKNYRRFQNQPEAHSTYGWVLYKVGKIEEAERVLANLINAGNYNAEQAYFMARVLVTRDHDLEVAKQLLKAAISSTAPFSQRNDAKELLATVTAKQKK